MKLHEDKLHTIHKFFAGKKLSFGYCLTPQK